jgi:hypothetical protein
MKLFFLDMNLMFFLKLTKTGLIVDDKILTYLPSVTIVFSYYNFKYGLHLSRYISSRHFSPEEQKPIYRLAALFARGAKADISARGTFRPRSKSRYIGPRH